MSYVMEILNVFEKYHARHQPTDLELLATWGSGKHARKAMKKWKKKGDKDLRKLGVHDPDDD